MLDDLNLDEVNFLRWLLEQNRSNVLDVHIDEFLTDYQRTLLSSIQKKLEQHSSY